MTFELMVEKIKNGRFTALVNYEQAVVSVDIGDGSEPFSIPFNLVGGLMDFLSTVKERVG